jgi:hypothetical protein
MLRPGGCGGQRLTGDQHMALLRATERPADESDEVIPCRFGGRARAGVPKLAAFFDRSR